MATSLKTVKLLTVYIALIIGTSAKVTAQVQNCPAGYEMRTVKCNGQFTQRCIPVNYTCKDCWALETAPCPGSGLSHGGLGNYNSYEIAFEKAEKEKNSALAKGSNYDCIINDPRTYRIYLDDKESCNGITGNSAAVINLKNKIIPFLKRYSAEISNYKNYISGQPYKPGGIIEEYKSTLRQAEDNASRLSLKLNDITDANLSEFEAAFNDAQNNEIQLKQADTNYKADRQKQQAEEQQKQQLAQQQAQKEEQERAAEKRKQEAQQKEAVRQQLVQQQQQQQQQNKAQQQDLRNQQSQAADNFVTSLNAADSRKDAARKDAAQAAADQYRQKINADNSSFIPKSNIIDDDIKTDEKNDNSKDAAATKKSKIFVYTIQNIKGCFRKTGDKTWGEFNLLTKEKSFTFSSIEETTDHVLLYDSSRKLYLKLTGNMCLSGNSADNIINKIYDGYWTDEQ